MGLNQDQLRPPEKLTSSHQSYLGGCEAVLSEVRFYYFTHSANDTDGNC